MANHELKREIGLGGAILMGLGSIVGTGVFVSIGVAAGVAGPHVLLAIFLASLVAICNGISSAQLAANHPVSGGTYEYGHRWLTPTMGFVAGWLFLCAKSASAATAALGLAAYIQWSLGIEGRGSILLILALASLVLLTIAVLVGIKRTNLINLVIVGITLATLALFFFFGFPQALKGSQTAFEGALQWDASGLGGLFYGTALMFVAYTGYGRIATMGEEVKDPRTTIPRAMVCTLLASMVIYCGVGFIAVGLVGPQALAESARDAVAPLIFAAGQIEHSFVASIVWIGAITAMAGVLLNLLLGLSRVALAMGRRMDLPVRLSRVDRRGVPVWATLFIVMIISILILMGDIRLSWSFSAMTVLVYYAITNACALRVEKKSRVFPVWPSWIGLASCLGLVFWIEPSIFIAGTITIVIGLFLRFCLKPKNANPAN